MKKLISSLVVFSVLFLIGCQENSITDPTQEDLQKTDDPQVQQGTLRLDGNLSDPRVIFSENYLQPLRIFGDVKFEHKFDFLQNKVHINLFMNAEIQQSNSTADIIWSVTGESRDIISLSDRNDNDEISDLNKPEPREILYKYYTVNGSDVGMRLVCKFFVTTNGVSLGSYSLQLQNVDGSYPDLSTI